ncbi:MAG TPA: hypothetical protein VF487_03720 [Chitinophagaceae bacterium]
MQSEDFDKKLREAADQHHPSYNETAWSKMEKMLDTHLPTEKKDRRRYLFFLLFFLLLGGGSWLLVSKPWEQSSTFNAANSEAVYKEKQSTTTSPASLPADNTSLPGLATNESRGTSDINTDKNGTTATTKTANATAVYTAENLSDEENVLITVDAPGKKSGRRAKNEVVSKIKDNQSASAAPVFADKEITTGPVSTDNTSAIVKTRDDKVDMPATIAKPADPVVDPPSISTDINDKVNEKVAPDLLTEKPAVAKPAKKKSPATTKKDLFVTLSAGPDISAIGISNTGKLRSAYGLGLGYTFTSKFTIRTGFYVTNKIYTAAPLDYKPINPPPNRRYLVKVDADCKVYEIPVTLAYQLGSSKKYSWFASAGLSSYLMKKEKYAYLYKYANGQTYTYKRIYENENKHLFSVLSLSGGYTRTINNSFTLSAEPYFKIPLSGIGHGNVKLNSAGMLFTLGVHPFSKNKKQTAH